MASDFGIAAISSVFTLARGIWTLVVLVVVALIRTWPLILARINERERDSVAEKAGDWDRLREEVTRLADRVEALERKVKDCEAERDDALRRAVTAETELIKLEAYHVGRGKARQEAATIVAIERLADHKRDEGDVL